MPGRHYQIRDAFGWRIGVRRSIRYGHICITARKGKLRKPIALDEAAAVELINAIAEVIEARQP